jgi:hypothetical protein
LEALKIAKAMAGWVDQLQASQRTQNANPTLTTAERGAVSLETILIIGAIALPVLIFLIKVGWPRVKGSFVQGMDELDSEARAAKQ